MELTYYHCPLNRKEFVPRWPRPSKGFGSSEEEYSWIKNQLQFLPEQMLFHDHQKFISMISPVMFLSQKRDLETLALYKRYKEQQRFLTQLYSKGNILEITLKKLSN